MMRKNKKPRKTVIFTVYLYRQCKRAQQEGYITMNEPRGSERGMHFNYLDSIPRQIRSHLASVGLTYDVDENSDDTVIAKKQRRRKVIRKIRR